MQWLTYEMEGETCAAHIYSTQIHGTGQPELAAYFEEIGPEELLADFLSAHLTNTYSYSMTDNNKRVADLRFDCTKTKIYHSYHQRFDAILTLASMRMYKESLGAKFTPNRYI